MCRPKSGRTSHLCPMLDQPPLLLNDDFRYALDVLEKSDNSLFFTGKAGTGKSTLLQLFRNTTRKKVAVLAPTGVAALNVQGQTIHSFFGFPPRIITPSITACPPYENGFGVLLKLTTLPYQRHKSCWRHLVNDGCACPLHQQRSVTADGTAIDTVAAGSR